jgi:hypothetical protein
MSSWERFSFAGPNVRLRSSTVEGLSNTASFCIETRCLEEGGAASGSGSRAGSEAGSEALGGPTAALSPLGW